MSHTYRLRYEVEASDPYEAIERLREAIDSAYRAASPSTEASGEGLHQAVEQALAEGNRFRRDPSRPA